jgi:hypothetical protein
MFRSAHAVVTIAVMPWLAGCAVLYAGPEPTLHEDLENSPHYISNETLNRVQKDGLTIDQVKALLGEPTTTADMGRKRAIGYIHCVEWSGQCRTMTMFIPSAEHPCTDRLCQVVGVWFDNTGHAFETDSLEHGISDRCLLREWLIAGGGPVQAYPSLCEHVE